MELTLSECTVLAATTSNPSRYNPLTHPKENAVRRKIVLEKMYEQNFITYDQKNDALDDDVYSRIQTVDNATSGSTVFSYFTDAVYNQVCDDLQSKLGYSASQSYKLLYSGGLQIYSTMDPSIQAIVDEEINNADNYISSTGSRLLEYSLNYALTVCHADGSESTYTENDLINYFQSEKNRQRLQIFMLQKKIFIVTSVNLKHHCLFLVTQLQTKPLLLFLNRRNLSLS